MVQKFIIQENHPKLLLFFAGWACDETPFRQYQPLNMDYMICYDYRNLDFDYSILDRYEYVNVVSWSMGVWAGAYVLKQYKPIKGITIAYNGTYFPIHDQLGIPIKVFEGTLQQLTPATLQKFMRRMCGHTPAYKEFMEITPRRNFHEIHEELQKVKDKYCEDSGIQWDKTGHPEEENESRLMSYIEQYGWNYDILAMGYDDAIFPAENLQRCLSEAHLICYEDSPHYDADVFKILLEDLWKMPGDEFFTYIMK